MLINIDDVTFGYDDKIILKDVNLNINERDRIGLIGMNGAGKSTFLNVIMKTLEPDKGEIRYKSNLKVGYLKQNNGLESSNTVYGEMKSVFSDIDEIELKIRELEKRMSGLDHESDLYRSAEKDYVRYNNLFESRDGYNVDVKIRTVLNGMGFIDSYDKEISVMSGGEKTRLALAKLLLEEPELLILDEPTNHLDFTTLEWLEKYLSDYKGSILIVSHDRYFLDKIAGIIWDLENTAITAYRGNYSKFKVLKKERIDYEIKEYEKQQLKINAMREYAEKNIVRATTSKSAKSRLHQLENMEILECPYIEKRSVSFRFEYDYDSVKEVLKTDKLKLSIGERVLIDSLDMLMLRGDKIAIVGDNGTGKSTLLKTLLGIREVTSGRISWGKNVKLSYYDQENARLNYSNTLLNEYYSRFRDKSLTEARGDLARMLLDGDDINKTISQLSGGERAKLCFAIMMSERGNTLVFDEPTNHIDLNTREELEKSLEQFTGSILCVSHDRYFIKAICNKVLELSNNSAKLYNCSYDEYLAIKADERAAEEKEKAKQTVNPSVKKYRSAKDRSEEVRIRNEFKVVEKNIEELESREKEITELMSGESDYRKIMDYSSELEKIKEQLDVLYERWEELSELM